MPDPELLSAAPVIGVDDVDAALEWWCGEAGFEARHVTRAVDQAVDLTNYAVVVRNAVSVHLVRRVEAAPGLGRGEVLIAVRGVDALAVELGAGDPTERPWGRAVVVRDPDGNRIEFYEPA